MLQLCKLLEVFQADEAVLQLGGHFCDFLQGICVEKAPMGSEQSNPGHPFHPEKLNLKFRSEIYRKFWDRMVHMEGAYNNHPVQMPILVYFREGQKEQATSQHFLLCIWDFA